LITAKSKLQVRTKIKNTKLTDVSKQSGPLLKMSVLLQTTLAAETHLAVEMILKLRFADKVVYDDGGDDDDMS
jgi:hypothetical protein